jgi:hypothetical protein
VDMEAEMYEIIKSKEFWQPPATEKGKEWIAYSFQRDHSPADTLNWT